jgi:hypothetical protein
VAFRSVDRREKSEESDRSMGCDPYSRIRLGRNDCRAGRQGGVPLSVVHLHRQLCDEFLGERVGQRVGQQGAEPVGQQIGALGTVEMKRHRGPP